MVSFSLSRRILGCLSLSLRTRSAHFRIDRMAKGFVLALIQNVLGSVALRGKLNYVEIQRGNWE